MNSVAGPTKPGLLKNPLFDEWSSGDPTEWTHTKTNATYSELRHTDPLTALSRAVFPRSLAGSRADYIYASNRGFRVTLASGAVAGNWIIRQDAASTAGIVVDQRSNLSVRVVSRCSVENNILRVQVIGIVGATDTYWLYPQNPSTSGSVAIWTQGSKLEWTTTSTNHVRFPMKDDFFTVIGIPVPSLPIDVTSVSILVSNGTAGSQVIDVGEVAMTERVEY